MKTSKLFYSVVVVLFFIIIAAFYLFVFEKSPNNTIKIGEIQTYSQLTSFTFPYRNGWQLALEEINTAGGVMGNKIEVISRDDQGKPGEAVKVAEKIGDDYSLWNATITPAIAYVKPVLVGPIGCLAVG